MIVKCIETGFTYRGKVYTAGEFIGLDETASALFVGFTAEQLQRRQTEIYGRVFFRLPTAQELFEVCEKEPRMIAFLSNEQLMMLKQMELEEARKKEKLLKEIREQFERMKTKKEEKVPGADE